MTNNLEEIPWELAEADEDATIHLSGFEKLFAVSMVLGAFFVLGLFML